MSPHPSEVEHIARARRRGGAASAGLLIAALSLGSIVIAPPAQAAVSTEADVLINEVYGGGGNSGAPFNQDFVELVNTGETAVDLSGWSVQYASAAGNSWNNKVDLSGSIQPGAQFLIGLATGVTGDALPTPDLTGSINLSGSNGKVALTRTTTELAGSTGIANVAEDVVDFVGYGTASDFAGAAAAPAASNTASVSRNADHANTADNAADFTAGAPTPQGSQAGTEEPEGPEEPEEPGTEDPELTSIADIQGAGAESPLKGSTVTTEGIVTAHYPTGGFNGYVIQTPGTGGAIDWATHTASQAIFVYAPGGAANEVQLGKTVRVTGKVGEFNGLTQIQVASGDAEVIEDAAAVTPLRVEWPANDEQRELLESMLVQPEGQYTVSNTYDTNKYGEVPLAFGDRPLLQPTDVARPGSAEAKAVETQNAERAVILDDGSSTNFSSAANSGLTPPYLSLTEPVVVGASVTFSEPVIIDYRNSAYKFSPTRHIVGDGTGADGVVFENVRSDAPAEVGGDLSVASFNVLNYFTTLGTDNDSCEAYLSPDGTQKNNVRQGCSQRGAWDAEDLERQEAKIVAAIEALDADIVGLMEIENSAKLGEQADEAVQTLVASLNNAAGSEKWAFVPSSAQLPAVDEQDVITNAIIFQQDRAKRVGDSLALGTESAKDQAFGNAREPIAQRFAPADGGEEVLFVVNHFKSKSSPGPWPGDTDSGDGQSASNESRVRQADALIAWVETLQGDTEQAVALVGDFNSYTYEDPMQAFYDAGYADAAVLHGETQSSYVYQGLSGSLDHVLLNKAASVRSTGADVWGINAGEALWLEYSRYGYNATSFHENSPYRSSDHDPIKVGLAAGEVALTEIDVLTVNDFHGRLEATGSGVAGAAVLAGAVKSKRAENPNTLFVSAGDNIGASTFTSLIQQDNPTIDTLVAAGLDVSAVGNHEFDRGFADLVDRVIPRFGGNTDTANVTEAQRELGAAYGLGANVYGRQTGEPALPEYAIKEVDGVRVAFIGTVTQDTATMVDPAGIADITFGDQVEAADRVAAELTDGDLADVIILLTHSGAAVSNDCTALVADQQGFGKLATSVSAEIDAIVSAHTHQSYACEVPVPGVEGETRPVIQASEYGKALGQLEIAYDQHNDKLVSIDGSFFALEGKFEADQEIADRVAGYVAEAGVIGAEPVGKISGDIVRGGTPSGADRGVESSMGNWVADAYLWATSANPAYGGTPAQIALMNPGGLRADLLYGADGVVSYKDAALVQPFANTLVTLNLTGAQLETILEQQWKATGDRPKLHLGVSAGFSYEYIDGPIAEGQTAARSGEIVSMSYQGKPIAADDTFVVVTNSFLANGGDGFPTFAEGTGHADTGQVDLDATLAYFEAFDVLDPAPLGRAVVKTDGGGETPTDDWAKVVLGSDTVAQGSSLSVEVSGLQPGQKIEAVLHSDPITVTGIPAANAAGVIRFSVAIPANFALGAHTLVVTTAGQDPIKVPVKVVAAKQLSSTGADLPIGAMVAAGGLLLVGGMLLALRRRASAGR